MTGLYCQIIFVFLVLIFTVIYGLVLIFKKDQAWRVVEWTFGTIKPQRTPQWEHSSTVNGVIVLIFGVTALMFILSKL